MRAIALLLVLLLSVAPLPAASAEGGPLLSDPKGDVTAETGLPGASQKAPLAATQTDGVDLLALEVEETDASLTFKLSVASLAGDVHFERYRIHFAWGDTLYQVWVFREEVPTLTEDVSADLVLQEDEDDDRDVEFVAPLDAILDEGAGTITVEVMRPYILDGQGRMPMRGDALKDIRVDALASVFGSSFGFLVDVEDRMPDDEGNAADYLLQRGDEAAGHLRMDAPERVRVSNGGATTFVYKVEVFNDAESDEDVDLAPGELPEGWNATVQSPVKVPGKSSRAVAVLASIPFGHTHGGFDAFALKATSRRDPGSWAVVRLGVLHTPIPQPAGHHSEIYLHAKAEDGNVFSRVFPFTQGYLNTESLHDGDVTEVSPTDYEDGVVWQLPLNPGLRMGLDFDLDRIGTLAGSVLTRANGEFEVSAELYLSTPSDDEFGRGYELGALLAESDEATLTGDLQKAAPFTLTLTPTADADYVAYQKDQNMVLVLRVSGESFFIGCCERNTSPALTTADFKLTLPLNEYHDKLDGESEAASLLDLVADGPVEKAARPGTLMTYVFTLKNGASVPTSVDVDLAGVDADLASLAPPGPYELAPGETRRLTLAVALPTNATDGEQFEVLLFAHAVDDPGQSAIARTLTTATVAGEASADESAVFAAAQADEKDTPFPGTLALLGVLVLLVLARRRG